MKLEVKVDEADVGQVAPGQQAAFTVDAFPEREFPGGDPAGRRRRELGRPTVVVDVTTASSASVVAYAAVLAVENRDLSCAPA